MNESGRTRFYLDKTGFFAESAVILLAIAIIFRIIGSIGMWNNRVDAIMLVLLPVMCCLLLILCIILFGKKGFFLSFIPVLLGVVFFVFKSLSFESWMHTVLCVILYVVVAVIYTATVIGWIHTKWLLPVLFGLPFIYHVAAEEIPALIKTPESVSFAAGMQEMSVLCIMAALFCIGMGLKKRETAPTVIEPEVVEPDPIPETVPAPVEETAPVEEAEAVNVEEPVEPEPIPETMPLPQEEAEEEPYHATLTLDPEPWEPEELPKENPEAPEAEQE